MCLCSGRVVSIVGGVCDGEVWVCVCVMVVMWGVGGLVFLGVLL